MKLSNREKHIVDFFKSHAGQICTFEQLMDSDPPFRKNWVIKERNKSMAFSVRKLIKKLEKVGIKIERTSKLGRSYKGVFFVDEKIANFRLE